MFASDRDASTLPTEGVERGDQVDATDEAAIAAYLDPIAKRSKIDVVVNLVAVEPAQYGHGGPATEVASEQLLIPFQTNTMTQFATAKAAFGHMAAQGSGCILFITSTLAKVGSPWSTALSAAHAATEGLMRSLASEWGPAGVRVLGVRSEAMPESPAIEFTFEAMGKNIGLSGPQMQQAILEKVPLRSLPAASDTAGVLAFAASDLASGMAGTMLNLSGGHILE